VFINQEESVMGETNVNDMSDVISVNDMSSSNPLVVNTAQITALADRFQQFSRKTAEGILEMARAVNEARQLPPSEFLRFCELIKMKTSNIKKLAVIGAKYDYLMSRADKLPANWTTVYAVARLANEEIDSLIDKGVVNSLTVVSDLEAALAKTNAAKPARITAASNPAVATEPDLSFHVQVIAPNDSTRHVLAGLLDQLRAMQMQVQLSAPLDGFLRAT
jgi:hypothetical protein